MFTFLIEFKTNILHRVNVQSIFDKHRISSAAAVAHFFLHPFKKKTDGICNNIFLVIAVTLVKGFSQIANCDFSQK